MSAPSAKEAAQIIELRGRLNNVLDSEEKQSDQYLIRWIRAREHDLDKAELMLRNDILWRDETKADLLLGTRCNPFLRENYPYWILGKSKQGHPVLEMPVGSWDMRKSVQKSTEEELIFFSTQILERLVDALRQIKNESATWSTSQIIAIFDWSGLSYGQIFYLGAVKNLLSVARKFESHFPEILFKAFFINCPTIFPLLFTVIKPLFPPATFKKILIHGSKREEWEPVIREFVDPDQLGDRFGGICTNRTVDTLL